MTAEQFHKARQTLGLTQPALAQALGMTERQVRRLETGESPIRPLVAREIDRMLAHHAHPAIYGRAPIIMIQRTKNDLRQAIQSEGTPRIQGLWDRLEQWIDSPPMMEARHD